MPTFRLLLYTCFFGKYSLSSIKPDISRNKNVAKMKVEIGSSAKSRLESTANIKVRQSKRRKQKEFREKEKKKITKQGGKLASERRLKDDDIYFYEIEEEHKRQKLLSKKEEQQKQEIRRLKHVQDMESIKSREYESIRVVNRNELRLLNFQNSLFQAQVNAVHNILEKVMTLPNIHNLLNSSKLDEKVQEEVPNEVVKT